MSAGPKYAFDQLRIGWYHMYKHLYILGEPDVQQFLTEVCDKEPLIARFSTKVTTHHMS